MPDTYYKLTKNNRWLDSDNPESINGRSTDVSHIGSSLEAVIKNLYPVNGVPESVATSLHQLKLLLTESEKKIDEFIEQVSQDMWYRQINKRY